MCKNNQNQVRLRAKYLYTAAKSRVEWAHSLTHTPHSLTAPKGTIRSSSSSSPSAFSQHKSLSITFVCLYNLWTVKWQRLDLYNGLYSTHIETWKCGIMADTDIYLHMQKHTRAMTHFLRLTLSLWPNMKKHTWVNTRRPGESCSHLQSLPGSFCSRSAPL